MTMAVAYASIKSGIIALTNYIATYFGANGIRANAISPGGIFDNQD
ncbi:MAG: SDR family oxidoreductase, partial [Bacteroidales bacterium]|nr:SDR family oxidoreductase [Bacteroidales bacterium]